VLTLAIAIGANTAIFSFVNSLLLRPFPFPDPDRLVEVYSFNGIERSRLSFREVEDLNERAKSFEGFAAYRDSAYNYAGADGNAEHLLITRVTGNLFRVLGYGMEAGKTWPALSDRSRDFQIVLTHEFWTRRFHSDPGVIGTQVLMDGFPNTVAGIAPPGLTFPSRVALFRCWGIDRDPNAYDQRDRRIARVIGRLKPGVSRQQGQAELASIASNLARDFPSTNARIDFRLAPLRDVYAGQVRPYLYLLLGAVGFVLLIACANVANLLLSKSAARGREMSIRTALGANRARLIRQVAFESLLYSSLGACLGLPIAAWAVRAIAHMITADLPPWMEVRTDGTVLLFLSGTALATALLAGVIPAIRMSGKDARAGLAEGGRGSARHTRLLGCMVTAEAAFAAVLLAGAGLMMQSFLRLQTVDLGFRTERLLTFHVGLSWKKYNLARARTFAETALHGLSGLPGANEAALTTALPLAGHETSMPISIEGQSRDQQVRSPLITFQQVSSNFHRILGIPLSRGRYFSDSDRENAPSVALVSEHFAKRFWPGQDPIGKRVLPDDVLQPWTPRWLTVVGVVGDIRHDSPSSEPGLDVYMPFAQAGAQYGDFVVRTSVAPMALMRDALKVVSAIDREEPASEWLTMQEVVDRTIWQRRVAGVVSASFAAVALLLASIGIYGVIAYGVNLRVREMGIRAALGAPPASIVRMILCDAARYIVPGIAAGLALALALGRLVSNLLYGITANDPFTFGGTAAVLTLVAIVACLVPATRAAKLDPIRALRNS